MKRKCMGIKLLVMGLVLFWNSQLVYGQSNESRYQIGVNAGYFMTGDLSFIYKATIGIEGQYFFAHHNKLHPFLSSRIATDIGSKGSRLLTTTLGIGAQYDLVKLWQKPLSISLDLGGVYWREGFSSQLLDRRADLTVAELSFMSRYGVGYRFSKHVGVRMHITHLGVEKTIGGGGFVYSF